jgi:hypothetical protein
MSQFRYYCREFWEGFKEGFDHGWRNYFMPLVHIWRFICRGVRFVSGKVRSALSRGTLTG